MSVEKSGRRKPGPPKAFDVDVALMAALRVFFEKGYDGTSLTDLTDAMGIVRPSLYATFGDKLSLFRQAVRRYDEHGQPYFAELGMETSARGFVLRWLRGQADLYTDPRLPTGCFLIYSSSGTQPEAQAARVITADRRKENERFLVQRLGQAEAGEIPPNMSPEEVASYVTAIGNGLAIRAADGRKRDELYRIIDLAMAFWPVDKSAPTAGEGTPAAGKAGKRKRAGG